MYGYAIMCSTNFRRTMHFAVRYHQRAPLAFISFAEAHRDGIWTIEPVRFGASQTRGRKSCLAG
jgi:hypothetical protein